MIDERHRNHLLELFSLGSHRDLAGGLNVRNVGVKGGWPTPAEVSAGPSRDSGPGFFDFRQ